MATDTSHTDPQAVPVTTMAIQLTQVRVPLDDAAEALSSQDEAGRLPIVVLPKQAYRIRNGLVLAGIIAILGGFVVDVTLPFATLDFPERYEGMSVRLPQSLVISEYFNYDRFGELVLAQPIGTESRPFTPTAIEEPGSTEYAARNDLNRRSRITLDDGLGSENPEFLRHPNGAAFMTANRFEREIMA